MKIPVIIAFILVWNIGCLVAIYLNGGAGSLTDPMTELAMGIACLAASIFTAAVGSSEALQNRVIAPTRRHNYRSGVFLFVAFLCGALSVIALTFSAAGFASNGA